MMISEGQRNDIVYAIPLLEQVKIPEDSQRNQRFRVTSALPQAKGDALRE